ncbi:MAG: DUF4142 domain-containing protein [Chitinophagaceae bacterium]
MKYNHLKKIFLTAAIAIVNVCAGSAQQADPVKKAVQANEQKAQAGLLDEEVAGFLVKAADARMMGQKEGALAIEKGTTLFIRQYGRQMVRDQGILLAQIKKLAAAGKISLPASISQDKEDGRKDLAEKTGKDFDNKFMKMMIIDHKRDIKDFKKAVDYKDSAVSAFAKKNLPLIQEHLDKIEEIKESK